MKELIEKLTAAYGPSGREDGVCAVIAELARPWAEVYRDPLGNLIAHRPGTGPRVMVAAHMDSLGLVATYVEPEGGYVRFGALGGLRITALLHQRVRFETGVLGVVCADGKADAKDLKVADLYVDVGGHTVRPGDTAVFDTGCFFMDDLVCSPYLDNRIGCAVALRALELVQSTQNDLYVVFTTQEEVGIRGAKTAAYTVDPALGLAVDVCLAADTPDPMEKSAVRVGGGPVISYMDKSVICHRSVVDRMLETAAALELPVQHNVATAGGTDGGALHQTRGGVPTGVLSIATRYIHTPYELCSLADAEQCARLLAALVEA